MPLKPGDEAPDFTLTDQHGEPFTLSESLRQRPVWHLIYFYPKADTGGCTAQACGLRDAMGDLGDTVVVGISPDPPERQARFASKYGLPFALLADTDHAVAEAWGTWGEKSLYGRRYLGVIRSAFLVAPAPAGPAIERAWYKVSPKATVANLRGALAAGK